MPIEVTIRHQNAAPGLKEYAELRAAKLMEQFPKIGSVRVVVDVQRHLYEAEIIVQQKNLTAVGTKEHADSARAVIDTAAARVEKQLRKMLNKRADLHTRNTDKK
ncbi:MAG TPA: ribosome-associated translation inhibitor RaiA [Kiritimatiellia bacterium]|nr:ribosome-associated translation inhibitor RaiA [Kiritimatiellia bacterium]